MDPTPFPRRLQRALNRMGLAAQRSWPFLGRRYRYRPEPRHTKAMGAELMAREPWSAGASQEALHGDLAGLFLQTPGLDKWLHYIPAYESALSALRNRPIRMLEIGVARGGSLAAWSQYLGEQATVVGIDIDPACAAFDAPDVRRHVRIGRQEDIDFLQSIVKEFGPFDVVLDDGSHQSSHLNASFRYLFEHGLVPGGRYIAEDLHANYWTAWRDDPLSFVDLTKGMIDLMHAHYTTVPSEAAFRVDSDERVESCTVPRITKLLQRIDVYDSLIVIYKADSDRKLPSTLRTRAARSSAS